MSAIRIRPGYGTSMKMALRNSLSPALRGNRRSICARVSSIKRPVLHARRTGRDAGHAAETGVEVPDEALGHADAPFEARLHQVEAAAWRIHLFAPQGIRRARRQAEAAMDALVDERSLGWMVSVEGGRRAACRLPACLSQWAAPRAQKSARIELALERAGERNAGRRSPDPLARLELGRRAQDDDVTEDIGGAHPRDDIDLCLAAGVDAEQPRPSTDPAR